MITSENKGESLQKLRTCSLLMNAMFDKLALSSFEHISLKDLCSTAMISRSTFYRYFEDKYALLDYCICFFYSKMPKEIRFFIPDLEQGTAHFFSSLFAHLSRYKESYGRIYECNRNGILIDMLKNHLKKRIEEELFAALRQGFALGMREDIFIDLLADFYFSAVICYLKYGKRLDLNEIAQNIEDFVWIAKKRGVCRLESKK